MEAYHNSHTHMSYIYTHVDIQGSPEHHLIAFKMGREGNGNDPIALHSSIALLQERFRQLQRVKEMREERELLMKNLGDQGRFSPAIHCQSSRLSSHPELSFPSPPPPEVTLSLWPSMQQIKHSSFQGDENPLLKRRELASLNRFHEPDSDCDVDTSLHL